MASGAAVLPFAPFIIGLVAIFVSGGNMLFMIAGDALVFLAGIAFLKAFNHKFLFKNND